MFRRAFTRSKGETPVQRGKHWKAKQNKLSDEQDENDDNQSKFQSNGELKMDTMFVSAETNLPQLIQKHFSNQSSSNFGIIGLHTCGNLAPDSIRIFLSNPKAVFLANVGCCYHHLNEEFYRNPYLTDAENDEFNSMSAFPMSSVLRNQKFELGRNARMMAAQPNARMAFKKEVNCLYGSPQQLLVLHVYCI